MLLREVQDFRNLDLLARQVVEGFINGLHRSPHHGFSVEFAEHRPYNPGESVRYLDWKLYGRTDRMFIKRFQEETNLRCRILIDTSASMHFPDAGKPKLQFSVLSAAAVLLMLRRQRDAFGLTTFGEKILSESPIRSTPSHFDALLHQLGQILEQPAPSGGSRIATLLHEIAEKEHRRSLILLFTDLFADEPDETLFEALQHLKYGQNEVIIFHITDRSRELELQFDNRPYKFTDMESGEEIKLQAEEFREAYAAGMAQMLESVRTRCRQYRIDFVEADTAGDFRQVLLPFLMKRQRMF